MVGSHDCPMFSGCCCVDVLVLCGVYGLMFMWICLSFGSCV